MIFKITREMSAGKAIERPLPPLRNMAANFLHAAHKNLGSVLNGAPVAVDLPTRQRRKAVCMANTCGYYRAADDRCAHPECGCWLMAKRWLNAEQCPVEKW